MTFVSYAQNFEDVIIWRALSRVESGFYIDVGAFDPVKDSVSLAFYERGWRGFHVEPIPQFAERFRALRPDEVVLECAVSNSGEPVHLYRFIDNGMTTASLEFASGHRDAGFSFDEINVPSRSLASIFSEVARQDIHWLKIDVEGMEGVALESWNDHPARPWVVVVEATKPRSAESNHDEWEHLLLQRDYRFVFFDGLNRFYVHAAHRELEESFSAPANVNDGFVLADGSPFCASLNARLAEAEARLHWLETQAPTNQVVLDRMGAVGHTLRTEMLNSFQQVVSQADIQSLLDKKFAANAAELDNLDKRFDAIAQGMLRQMQELRDEMRQQVAAQSEALKSEQASFLLRLAQAPLGRLSAMLRLLKGD